MERAFVATGGLLLAGPDPTGRGDVLPGFGDQREIELLVEAGFSPVEAIKIATLNGATYLGRDQQIGSVAAGKNADLIVLKGDPSKQISDIENVEIVFKDGVGYDSRKLRPRQAGPPFPRRCFNLRLPHPCPLCKGGRRRRGKANPTLVFFGLAGSFPVGRRSSPDCGTSIRQAAAHRRERDQLRHRHSVENCSMAIAPAPAPNPRFTGLRWM